MKLKIPSLIFLIALSVVGLSIFVEASSLQKASFPLHVNAGGDLNFTASDGREFLASRNWTAGSWGFVDGTGAEFDGYEFYATGGSDIRPVFATQQQKWKEFRVSSIPNGSYLVALYFKEIDAHGVEINRFDVLAEGQIVVDDLDVYEQVGRDYVLVRQFSVPVLDGELNLHTDLIEGITHISALSIRPIVDDDQPPPVPASVTAQGSYDANQLSWNAIDVEDLKGYIIYRSSDGGPFTPVTTEPIYITRYQDRTAELGKTYQYQVSAIDVFGHESGRSPAVSASRLSISDASLPVLDLTIDPFDWKLLYSSPYAPNTISGQLLIDGTSYEVSVRYRGAGSRLTNKKNWKIRFEGASPFPDRDTINLNADNMDYTYLRGPVSYQLMNAAGIDAPQHRFALFFVNGRYMGVYNDYEQIDENFMVRTGRDDDTTVYKAQNNLFRDLSTVAEYENAYDKNNNSGTGHSEIIELIETLANASDDRFPWELQHHFDIKSYLDFYAYVVWVGQYDAFEANNYLLYDEKNDKWEMIPWDFDFAFGTRPSQFGYITDTGIDLGMDQDRLLPQRGVNVPQYRQYFCHKLEEYDATILTPAGVSGVVSTMQSQMLPDARRDWLKIGWEDSAQLENLPAEFADFVAVRKEYLDARIPEYCDAFNRPFLKLNEVVAQGDGGDWIEIYNEGLLPIDLNGMYLSDSESNLRKHQIGSTLIVPPLAHVVLWADGQSGQGVSHLGLTLADASGAVFLSDSSGSMIDSLSWSALPKGYSVARLPDGTEAVELFSAPTLGFANTKRPPEISKVSHDPPIPNSADEVTIQATVDDEGIVSATLFFQVDGDGFRSVPMTAGSDMVWTASIPAQADGRRIQYYISAKDSDGASAVNPALASDEVYEYLVGYKPPTLYINELMASNNKAYFDPDEPDESPDYVEIYNPGPWAVNLAGMYITDDLSRTQRYRLAKETDQLVIQAGELLLLLIDDDGTQGPNHAGFKLSKGGEDFGIFDRKDLGNSELDSYSFGEQTTDVAIGRCGDGGSWQVLPSYSPGQSNRNCGKQPPEISDFVQTPKWPIASNSEPVYFELTVTDDESVVSVQFNYRFEDGGWVAADMSKNRDSYSYVLPGIARRGLIVEYYFEATDNTGLTSVYPLGAPERLNRYMYHTSQPAQYPSLAAPSTLVINEFVANGVSYGIQDPDEQGERTAWLEIYNSGILPIDLEGYRLAHALHFPHDYVIPAGVTVPADGYVVFLLDDDPEQGVNHAAFKPVRSGDTVGLYTPYNILVDEISYGSELEDGAALVRVPDEALGTKWIVAGCVTPGSENQAFCDVYLPFISR